MKDNGNGERGGSNGSLAGANTADLKRGYTECGKPNGELHDVESTMSFDEKPVGGFAGRPSGWER